MGGGSGVVVVLELRSSGGGGCESRVGTGDHRPSLSQRRAILAGGRWTAPSGLVTLYWWAVVSASECCGLPELGLGAL
jgi:hypothetical protein